MSLRITGTFLDEITYDIPSNNWGEKEWAEDFRIMELIGIDTVILIRAGLRNVAAFPSKVLQKHIGILPVHDDLVDMFLSLAEQNGMDFYFGTYYPDGYSQGWDIQKELDINKALIEEAREKYGSREAFAGWYLSHEIGRLQDSSGINYIQQLGKYCKNISPDEKVIISPYIYGDKISDAPISPEQHGKEWDEIFAMFKGHVDIVCFQDGTTSFESLPDYLSINKELIHKYGMIAWSNVETFDRDMPIKFPPIDWRKLLWKMDCAKDVGYDKLITFEFSHFLSPNSQWASAKNLFKRYCEHFDINLQERLMKKYEKHTFVPSATIPKKRKRQPDIVELEAKTE